MYPQTRQQDRLKLREDLKKLNLSSNSERERSLFNKLFRLIGVEEADTDTTASGMRDKLVETLNNEAFQIQPDSISQALKEFEKHTKDNVTTSTPPVITTFKTVTSNTPQRLAPDSQQPHLHQQTTPTPQPTPSNQPSGQTFVPDLKKMQGATLQKVKIEDTILSNSDTDRYIIIDAIPLSARKSSNPLHPTYDLESTDVFFCFKDPNVRQQYEDRINNYKAILGQLEKEKDKAKTEAELKPLLEEINAVNQEILNTYAAAEIAAYSGYKVTRKNGWGKLTNQSAEAKDLEIVTKQLSKKDALRIRLRSGGFLEIHLDENGNYDPTRPPIPLTALGAKQPRLFTELDADPRLVDNNFGRTLGDLKFLNNLTINGEPVLSHIIDSIEQKHAKQIAHNEELKESDSQTDTSDLDSDSESEDTPNPKGQKPAPGKLSQRARDKKAQQDLIDESNVLC